MKKYIKKELKKHPYTSRSLLNLAKGLPSQRYLKKNRDRYAVVDSKGKIIEKFRYKMAAVYFRDDVRNNYYEKLEIVEIEYE